MWGGREAMLEGDGGKNLLEVTLGQKDPRARRELVRGASAGRGSWQRECVRPTLPDHGYCIGCVLR